MDALLFSPLTLRGLTLRNRVVLSPMLTYSVTNGYTNDTHLAHLPPVFGHYLGGRQRSFAGLRNSTWQTGIKDGT